MAVVVMSVGMVIILQTLANNFRASLVQQDYLRALFLVQDQMEDRFSQDAPQVSQPDQPAPPPWEKFHYHYEYKILTPQIWQGLKELELAVSWPAGKTDRNIALKAFLLDKFTQEKKTSVLYN